MLPGQAGTEATTIHHDATTLTLPAGSLPLKDVVDATAAFLEVNILYDETEVLAHGGVIALQTPLALERGAAEDAVCDLTFGNGFVLAPRDAAKGLYELVFLRGPKARGLMQMAPQRTIEQVMSRPLLKQPVATSFRLQNTNATIASNALRPFFASTGGGAPTGLTFGTADNQTMLVAGIQCEVVKAIELLRRVDVETENAAGQGAPEGSAPTQFQILQLRIAELERTIAELRQEVATLRQRKGDGK